MALTYSKHERLSLRDNPELDEKWVQDRIAEDPKILGLGDLVLKDRERPQPRVGRLDLLLQDPETDRRYEVELQLGPTDESHIIRTLEYWDIERKRYPQYDHAAVIIAEDITSRFLNVVGLFNGFIPLIAIQMAAIRVGDSLSLVFTTVLDELTLGLVDEDEDTHAVTDRSYWEQRGAKETVQLADRVLELVKQFDPGIELKYNKFYIGLAKQGHPNNFVSLVPQKSALRVGFRLARTDELDALIQTSGVDTLGYDKRWSLYRLRLSKGDLEKHTVLLKQLIERARAESGG